jgi:flagellar M-ring protein FliF
VNPRVSQTLDRAKGFMEGFTPGQRSVVIVAAIGLLMGAFALSRWVAQPTWTPLYGNLSGADASAVVEQLDADGVKYKLADGGGTILIPQDQVYAERIAISGKGLQPTDGGDGWSLLDEQGITATDFQQNIAYQRAIQGELAKTLEAMDGVNTAVVNLAVPKKDVFSSETDKTTSSVLLSLKPGTDLSNEQITSITNLVAGSVAGLDPDDVTVTDQTGQSLSGGGSGSGAGNSSQTDEQTAAFEDRQAKAAQAVLDKVVGPGHSVVRVNAQLDFDDTTGTSKVYTVPSPSAPPLSEANVTENYSGNGANAGGTLGQILPTAIATSGAAGSYNRSQNTKNNTLNEVVTKTDTAPGGVKRMTVAVVLDSKTAAGLNPTRIQNLIANAVGLDPTRGDTVQVDNLPFDTTAADAANKELAAAAKAARTTQYLEIGKKSAIALLILIVLFVVLRRRKKDADTVIDVTADDLPNNGMLMNVGPQAAIGGGGGPGEQLAIAAESEKTRNKMKDDVTALVDNQPDDVAEMLQGWLAERKS